MHTQFTKIKIGFPHSSTAMRTILVGRAYELIFEEWLSLKSTNIFPDGEGYRKK